MGHKDDNFWKKTKPKPQPYGGNPNAPKAKAWTPEQGVQGGKKPAPPPAANKSGPTAAAQDKLLKNPKSAPQPYGGNAKLLAQTKAWTPPSRPAPPKYGPSGSPRPPITSNLVRPDLPPAPIDWASRTNEEAQRPRSAGGRNKYVEGYGTKFRLMNENEQDDSMLAVKRQHGPEFGVTEDGKQIGSYLSKLNTGVPEGTLPRLSTEGVFGPPPRIQGWNDPATPVPPFNIQRSPYAPKSPLDNVDPRVISNIVSNLGAMRDHTKREALDTIAFDKAEDIRVAEKNPLSPGEVAFIAGATGMGSYGLSKLLGFLGAATGPAAPVLAPAGYLAGGYYGGKWGNELATWAVGQDWSDLDMEPSWSYWPNQVEAAEREAAKTGVPVNPDVYRTGGIGSDFVPGAIHGFQNWLYGTPLAETRGDYRGSGTSPIAAAAAPAATPAAATPPAMTPEELIKWKNSLMSQVGSKTGFSGRLEDLATAPNPAYVAKPPAAAAAAPAPIVPIGPPAAPASPAPEPGGGGGEGDGMSEFEKLAQLMEIGKYARQPDNTRENELYNMLQESQNQMQALQQQYIEALIKQLNNQPQFAHPAPAVPGAPAAAGNMYPLGGIPKVASTGSNLQFSNAGLGYLNSIDPSLLQALMQYLKAMNYTGQGQMGTFGEMNYLRQGGIGSLLQSDASFENPLAYAGLTPQMREPAEAGLRSLFAQMGLMG